MPITGPKIPSSAVHEEARLRKLVDLGNLAERLAKILPALKFLAIDLLLVNSRTQLTERKCWHVTRGEVEGKVSLIEGSLDEVVDITND